MDDKTQTQQAPKAEAPKKEDAGSKPHIIQAPTAQSPGEIAAQAIEAAEADRAAREQAEADERAKTLPQNVLDEMEAGKAALKRHAVAAPQAVSDRA